MFELSTITRLAAACVLGVLAFAAPRACRAGGGPENVLLVVNAARDDSKEIANHYVRLREIPATNVVYLNYEGDPEKTTGDQFRQEILFPALKAVDQRGLSNQIDIVAYSSGFPWQIDLRPDFPKDQRPPRSMNPVLSLTGATFFWQAVLAKQPVYLSPTANAYAVGLTPGNQSRCQSLAEAPTRAFRGQYRWKPGGVRVADKSAGQRYLLSTVLGVTTGRGNSVQEVLESLRRSVAAEESPPQGVFCYVKNGGVRSTTRDKCYPAAAAQLTKLGARAAVEKGDLPRRGTRVAGMMLGAAALKLAEADLQIEPGAICEHLTSSGGDLSAGASQTPLTDLIRYGASGSSGTVEEPFALQWKFPLPSLQVHYRRGCSLAEAYYLSVGSPYQLLIVGDPLCQPWAARPSLVVEGWPTPAALQAPPKLDLSASESKASGGAGGLRKLDTLASLKPAQPKQSAQQPTEQPAAEPAPEAKPGELLLKPIVTPAGGGAAAATYQLFIDGKLRARLPSGQTARLSAELQGAGWHEVRCVGIDPGPVGAQRRLVGHFDPGVLLGNEPAVSLEIPANKADFAGQTVAEVSAEGAERIVLLHNGRAVGQVAGAEGRVQVDASLLGRGPVRLQAFAEPMRAFSAPVWLTID